MKFNKGDKVRFLNEEGSGTVTAVEGKRVHVLTAEGMEIVYEASQLVHADVSKIRTEHKVENVKKKTKDVEPVTEDAGEEETDEGSADGIYLLLTPVEENKLMECDIEIGLVNNTDYDIIYSYSYKYEKDFVAMCNGTAEEGSVTQLDTIVRMRMDEYATVKLDIIFFKNMPYEALEPVSEIIKLKTVKFYKPNTWQRNVFSEKLAHLVPVCLFEDAMEEKKEFDAGLQKKVAEFMSRKREDGKNISRSHDFYAKQLEKEVDLHLEELVDNVSGMSNSEKLNYQLNHFRRELEGALAGNIRKIVFIHGVGSGKLKAEICNILDTYHLRYHDASFRKYGFGATEVILR